MELESIKLSGFKSFADKTVLSIRSHKNAIVGPNGCGKSNVVDAIRWVIGETSAKQLRSQSMADVIFNGTTKRSASGRAFVELTFNNHMGRLAGPFADFDTITIAREVTADGQSKYMINQRTCRRKDILDLFSGTGMGSRSYSIIEQGMISRLIEAKPEELRIFLEEACGISKYKDRRKETQTRMRHCEENLERVNDICQELETQHRKLSRQARNAERYKELSSEEHTLKNQVLALKHQDLQNNKTSLDQTLGEAQTLLDETKTAHDVLEAEYEALLATQQQANSDQHEQQRLLYEHQGKIQSIEQTLAHQQQEKVWREEHLARANEAFQDYQATLTQNTEQASSLNAALDADTPLIAQSESALRQIEQSVARAKEDAAEKTQAWNVYVETFATLESKANLFEQKLKHLEYLLEQAQTQQAKLQEEMHGMDLSDLQNELNQAQTAYNEEKAKQATLEQAVETNAKQWQTLNNQQREAQDQLASARTALQQANGRLASLEALQEAALHDDDSAVKSWLSDQRLDHLSRLAQELKVDEAWEQALEVVLADAMTGVCVREGISSDFVSMVAPKGSITLLTKDAAPAHAALSGHRTMADVVQTEYALPVDLSAVILADDEIQAKSIAANLPAHASVILKDGRRFGRGWGRFTHTKDVQGGILQRGRALEELKKEIATLEAQVESALAAKEQLMQALSTCERARETLQNEYQAHMQTVSDALAKQTAAASRHESQTNRHRTITEQLAQLVSQIEEHQTQMRACQASRQEAASAMQTLGQTREQLLFDKEAAENAIAGLVDQLSEKQSAHQQLMMGQVRKQDQLQALQQMIEKNQTDIDRVSETRAQLLEASDQQTEDSGLQEQLSAHRGDLQKQQSVVEQLQTQLRDMENQLRQATDQKHMMTGKLEKQGERVSSLRLELQSCVVKQAGVLESFELENTMHETAEQALDYWMANLPQEMGTAACADHLAEVSRKIARLGPINLAAIEECDEIAERKDDLEKQQADLNEALATLRAAIADIDEECKATLQATYDKVNARFQEIFPSVFGGGKANLEMMSEDILTTGILVRAQPPGKTRCSHSYALWW